MEPRRVFKVYVSAETGERAATFRCKAYLYIYRGIKFAFIPKDTLLFSDSINSTKSESNVVLEFRTGLYIPFKDRPCPGRATRAVRMAYNIIINKIGEGYADKYTGKIITKPNQLIASALSRFGHANEYKKHADYFELIETEIADADN